MNDLSHLVRAAGGQTMKMDPYIHAIGTTEMPRYAVSREIRFGSEDIAWFFSKRLAREYLKFKQSQNQPKAFRRAR